jgi:hypothetical protein
MSATTSFIDRKKLLGLPGLLVLLVGCYFKGRAWRGADLMVFGGFAFFLAVVLFFTARDAARTAVSGTWLYVQAAALLVTALTALFRLLHQPGGSLSEQPSSSFLMSNLVCVGATLLLFKHSIDRPAEKHPVGTVLAIAFAVFTVVRLLLP